jgi:hypothetical protein
MNKLILQKILKTIAVSFTLDAFAQNPRKLRREESFFGIHFDQPVEKR